VILIWRYYENLTGEIFLRKGSPPNPFPKTLFLFFPQWYNYLARKTKPEAEKASGHFYTIVEKTKDKALNRV